MDEIVTERSDNILRIQSADAPKSITAFFEKRRPDFKNSMAAS
jgi:hypothetical protein